VLSGLDDAAPVRPALAPLMANGPLAALDRAQAQQRQQALAATPGSILSFFKPKPVLPQQVDENRMRARRQRLWQQFLESWRGVLNGGSSTPQYHFLMCIDQSPASRWCRLASLVQRALICVLTPAHDRTKTSHHQYSILQLQQAHQNSQRCGAWRFS